MASVASQLKEGVTAHAQSDGLEDAREICADGTYFPNNLRNVNNTLACNMEQFTLIEIYRCFEVTYRRHRPTGDRSSRSYLNFDKLLLDFTLSYSRKIFSVTGGL